jgi:hypothetical protein
MFGFSLIGMKFWNIRWRAAIDHWAPHAGQIMMDALQREAPFDSDPFRDPSKPHLRDSFKIDISNSGMGTEGQIDFYGPDLASLLEAGAPPHEILGNPVLHFFVGTTGDEVFADSVFHPGFQKNRFVERAYSSTKDEIFHYFVHECRDNIHAV